MFKEVIMAENAGFFFDVKRAVDTSIDTNNKGNSNIYTFGPLVHNKDVTNSLKKQGINQVDTFTLDEFSDEDTVIIRSHGVAPSVWNLLKILVLRQWMPHVLMFQPFIKE